MTFLVLIPARMKSSRLPGKPIADICGKPMVVRVAETAMSSGASRVVVAVDDERVADVCLNENIECVMTNSNHSTGTDRLSEAVGLLGLNDEDIVVNLQGDEPLMPVSVIQQVAELLEQRKDCDIATAAHRIYDIESFLDPNVVKVVLDNANTAITFSRAPIPWPRDHFRKSKNTLPDNMVALHHLGIYAYRVGFLKKYPKLEQAPLEALESLEQLRALYYGKKIAVAVLDEDLPAGVDTIEDLNRVRQIYSTR